jgi:hypothetical protein
MSNMAKQLHKLIHQPCFDRPFVCDGLPEQCNVIVIGENPATRLKTDWWSFWNDKTGFDLQKFERMYAKERQLKNNRPVSNTRLRLNRLRDFGLQCLETNTFINEGSDNYSGKVSNKELLDFFLKRLPRLSGVIAHGAFAKKFLTDYSLPEGVQKYFLRHFRSESYQNIDDAAKKLLKK